jgi:hypothetical protein|tara:strand:+ start:11758 stop:13635 length:1878 start_codon:yes stop_codon:yes gene_type:complete
MATTTSATETKKLEITELDFDQVKSNLKQFLRNQSEFADYDFEGSGMSVLLDTLAYNTHYLGFNANMLGNEMFLDSAEIRSSVVSLAKMLGYTPSSVVAPTADITLTLTNATGPSVTMPAGTAFTTTVDGLAFNYVTNSDKTITPLDGVYAFTNLSVYEGTRVTFEYTVDSTNEEQRYVVNNSNADITTLGVLVQNSSTDTKSFAYKKASSIAGVTASDKVYFCQEVENGKFEIYFGDGVTGFKPSDGNIVKLTYIVTNKAASNGASTFTLSGTVGGFTGSVSTNSVSSGGTDAESIASVKLNAPLQYSAQDRAVTAADYKTIVKQIYPSASAIQVWGGEDNAVPTYGRVYISIKAADGTLLTSAEKADITTQLENYAVASVRPILSDPETTFIVLKTTFKYDSNLTVEDATTLSSKVQTVISDYSKNNLNNFVGVFRHSQLTGQIDVVDSSILSNITTVQMYQTFKPLITSTASQAYSIDFNNAIYNPHTGHSSLTGVIQSSGFQLDGNTTKEYFFNDDGSGNIRLYYLVSGVKTYENNTWGTITYTTGQIKISSAIITAVSNVDNAVSTTIKVTAKPESNDIAPVRGQVLNIDTTNSTVTGEVDTISSGSGSSGVDYTTTSSY